MDPLASITILAQRGNPTGSILGWSIGLIVMVLVLLAAVVWMRRRLSPTRESGQTGFSLADLRALRQKGAINQEEFERAKARIVQGLKPPASTAVKAGNRPEDQSAMRPPNPGKS